MGTLMLGLLLVPPGAEYPGACREPAASATPVEEYPAAQLAGSRDAQADVPVPRVPATAV